MRNGNDYCPSLPTQELEGIVCVYQVISGLIGTFQVTRRDKQWQLLITHETDGGVLGARFDLISILSHRSGRSVYLIYSISH